MAKKVSVEGQGGNKGYAQRGTAGVGETMIRLHIGCGHKHFPQKDGWINIDISPKVGADLVADICHLPFGDNSIDEIYTAHTLEHVPFEPAMRELHRVLKPGGKLKIVVPYATSITAHIPQHLTYFSLCAFDPFAPPHYQEYYYDFHFTKYTRKLWFFWWNRIIAPYANKHLCSYENSFLCYLFPALELHVELIK